MTMLRVQPLANVKYKAKFYKLDANSFKIDLSLVTGDVDWAPIEGEKDPEAKTLISTVVDSREYTKTDFPLPTRAHQLYTILQKDGKLTDIIAVYDVTQTRKESIPQREHSVRNENNTVVMGIYSCDPINDVDVFSDNTVIAFSDSIDEPSLVSEYDASLSEVLDTPIMKTSDEQYSQSFMATYPKVTITSADTVQAGQPLVVTVSMEKVVNKSNKIELFLYNSMGVSNKQRISLADGESSEITINTEGLVAGEEIIFKVNFYNYTSFAKKTIAVV